jgi:hypothetical protein
VGDLYLEARLNALRRAQNPDGGFGYFPRRQSWLEPTAWAALALHGDSASDRAWTLLKSWQIPDGGWHPSADVQISSWGTALCVTLASVRGEYGESFRKGVDWLLDSAGVESNVMNRVASRVGLLHAERDLSLKGWPWKPNTASWVEPTAHTLVALKKAAARFPNGDLHERVRLGEAQLMDVRCRDFGWNYGSREALGIDLPSYPETTALALIGLQGRKDVGPSVEIAKRWARETPSPLARAWLTIALRLHRVEIPDLSGAPTPDLLLTALEAVACGHYKFLGASINSGGTT